MALGDRPPEALQWLGASFGLTQPLFNFWSRAGYAPVYLRQTASDITGAPGSVAQQQPVPEINDVEDCQR